MSATLSILNPANRRRSKPIGIFRSKNWLSVPPRQSKPSAIE